MDALYTAVATATHGRDGRAFTNDGKVDVKLAPPVELGGNGEGTNPEQLFAAGYSACFASAISGALTWVMKHPCCDSPASRVRAATAARAPIRTSWA